MLTRRTDLALEAQELWKESAEKTTRLPGVRARTRRREGWPITRVEILNDTGAKALGKPVGTYVTVDLTAFRDRREDFFPTAVANLPMPVDSAPTPLVALPSTSSTGPAAAA